MELKITTDHTLAYSPAFKLVMSEWAKLVEQDIIDPVLNFNNTNIVTYAETTDGRVVGATVYSLDTGNKQEAWILMTAIDPNFRRQGIASSIFNEIVRICKNKKIKTISSNVHMNNTPMINLLKKQNREVIMVRSRLKLSE